MTRTASSSAARSWIISCPPRSRCRTSPSSIIARRRRHELRPEGLGRGAAISARRRRSPSAVNDALAPLGLHIADAADDPRRAGRAAGRRGGRKERKNDHRHARPFRARRLLETLRSERRLFPSVKVTKEGPATRMAFAGAAPTRPVAPRLSHTAARKAWLGAQGIDCQVAGGWLDLFGYELPPEEGADWARFMNETMLAGAKDLPAVKPLATVPLQSGKLAARILDEAHRRRFSRRDDRDPPKGTRGALDDPDSSRSGRRRRRAGRPLSPPDVRLRRRSAQRLRPYQRRRARDRHDHGDGAAPLFRPFAAPCRHEPHHLAWRRRLALSARAAAAQQRHSSRRICRRARRVPPALFRYGAVRSARPALSLRLRRA